MKTEESNKESNEVVVILPYVKNKILMQLRDEKQNIVFPGMWGMFSGSIHIGESQNKAAFREIKEEICYQPIAMMQLSTDSIRDQNNICSHSFFCKLTTEINKIKLREGIDLGLFTLDEIKSGKLYSKRFDRFFSVIPSEYIPYIITRLMNVLNNK